ncbi:predicted protein [Nematostella vectensis]|uniref:Uncharacterized protein n=1 Tax=Nematostella vectensis TaxID=45351 RepID=A7RI76_NEMVE|nr:predicted protein [Nematostella vectensis]|eukprot:XP_001640716.1 predicted protein [Nematostella vectensis]
MDLETEEASGDRTEEGLSETIEGNIEYSSRGVADNESDSSDGETGKIGIDELPRTGIAKLAKQMFESQAPYEVETEKTPDLMMVSEGLTREGKERFEKGEAYTPAHRVHREVEDLPEKGTASSARAAFVSSTTRQEFTHHMDDDLPDIQGGVAAVVRGKFESGQASNVEVAREGDEEDYRPAKGTALSTRAKFEQGEVYNASTYRREEDEALPEKGLASKTKQMFLSGAASNTMASEEEVEDPKPEIGTASKIKSMFEKGEIPKAEAVHVGEVDELEEVVSTGIAVQLRTQFQKGDISNAEKREKRLSYNPEKGTINETRSIFKDPPHLPVQKEQNDVDNLPSKGVTHDYRWKFETGTVTNAEGSVVDRDEALPTTGTARAQMAAFQAAAERTEYQKTCNIEEEMQMYKTAKGQEPDDEVDNWEYKQTRIAADELPARGVAAQTRAMIESGSYETHMHRTLDDEELLVTPGSARAQREQIERGEYISKPKRLIDEEELPAGVAKEHLTHFERGDYIQAPKKVIDEEDFQAVSGLAKEHLTHFERGDHIHAPKKAIEDENLNFTPGIAREQQGHFERGDYIQAPKKAIDEEDLSFSQGLAREQQQQFEREAYVQAPKKTIDEEDLNFSKGLAREQQQHFERGEYEASPPKKTIDEEELSFPTAGQVSAPTRRLVDEEELSQIRGVTRMQSSRIERGELQHAPSRIIDDEEIVVAPGAAQRQKWLIEQGAYTREVPKYIDQEDFSSSKTARGEDPLAPPEVHAPVHSGSFLYKSYEHLVFACSITLSQRMGMRSTGQVSAPTRRLVDEEELSQIRGVTRMQSSRIERGELQHAPSRIIDDEEIVIAPGAAQRQKWLIEQGAYTREVPKYIDQEDFSSSKTARGEDPLAPPEVHAPVHSGRAHSESAPAQYVNGDTNNNPPKKTAKATMSIKIASRKTSH